MRRTKLMLLMMIAVSTVATMTTAAAAVSPPDLDRRAEHQRIVEFWTPERVAQAVPRDFTFEPARGFVPTAKPDRPGKPGGGEDGGDSTTVTGASWNSGGVVLNTTGKVLFQMGASYYVCSASVVTDHDRNDSDSLILTAAHCAFDEATGLFATNWMFIPAYDKAPATLTTDGSYCDQTEFGCWTATALTVHGGYAFAGGFNDEAVQYDFAFATVFKGGKGGSTALDALVGDQGISFTAIASATEVYAFGYPAAQKFKGNDLVYCSGPVANPPANLDPTYRIECQMTGGSSGGPWFSPFVNDDSSDAHGTGTLVSVNSYGYRGDSGMYGPKFNAATEALFLRANGAKTNAVVSP